MLSLQKKITALDIIGYIKSIEPETVALLLVGSAVSRSENLVNDLDFIAFSPALDVGEIKSHSFTFIDKPASCIIYNPDFFYAIAKDSTSFLLYWREIKKIHRGMLIFGSNVISPLMNWAKKTHLLEDFIAKVRHEAEAEIDKSSMLKERLSFYHSIEHIILNYMFIPINAPYSKPKWTLEDAKHLKNLQLYELLYNVAKEAESYYSIADMIASFQQIIVEYDFPVTENVVFHTKDAQKLVGINKEIDAFYPMHTAVFQFLYWYSSFFEVAWTGIRGTENLLVEIKQKNPVLSTLISEILLFNYPIPANLELVRQSLIN